MAITMSINANFGTVDEWFDFMSRLNIMGLAGKAVDFVVKGPTPPRDYVSADMTPNCQSIPTPPYEAASHYHNEIKGVSAAAAAAKVIIEDGVVVKGNLAARDTLPCDVEPISEQNVNAASTPAAEDVKVEKKKPRGRVKLEPKGDPAPELTLADIGKLVSRAGAVGVEKSAVREAIQSMGHISIGHMPADKYPELAAKIEEMIATRQ